MRLVLLHLSDIHINSIEDPILGKAKDVAEPVFKFLPDADRVVIVISGDIAFSGESIQYETAANFLEFIRQAISDETTCGVEFVIAPGNHDCDFDADTTIRRAALSALDSGEIKDADIDGSVIDSCCEVQKEFFEFRESLESLEPYIDDKIWRSTDITIGGHTVAFDAINLSWTSRKHELLREYSLEHMN